MKTMKKIIAIILITAFAFSACKKETAKCNFKESTTVASQAESDSVNRYLIANNISGATKHPAGFYYKIQNAGNGTVAPSLCSYLTVGYAGYYLNGTLLDATSGNQTIGFNLGELILGWQKGLPLIRSGGNIDLYLPPSMAYGTAGVISNGVVKVPPNAYLRFTINLAQVQ